MGNRKKRNDGIDFIKGICILLVVLDHAMPLLSTTNFPRIVGSTFGAIFLKGFFCVSGYLYYSSSMMGTKKGVLAGDIKKKFIGLIFPYVIFSCLAIVWQGILAVGFGCQEISGNYTGWNIVWRNLYCMLSGVGIGTLWFLPVLFVTYTLLAVTVYLTGVPGRKQNIVMAVLFLLAELLSVIVSESSLTGGGMLNAVFSSYQNMLYRILYGFAYSLIGYLFHVFYQKYGKNIKFVLEGTVICLLLSIVGWYIESMLVFEFGVNILFFLASLFLFDCYQGLGSKPVMRQILYCGQNSLAIMISHYIFLLPLEKMLLKQLNSYQNCSAIAQDWIFFAVNLITTLIVVICLNHTKWGEFALGKGKKFQILRQSLLD